MSNVRMIDSSFYTPTAGGVVTHFFTFNTCFYKVMLENSHFSGARFDVFFATSY